MKKGKTFRASLKVNRSLRHLIGSQLEKTGWRQGSVVRASDVQHLLDTIDDSTDKNEMELLVASQSCDIANNNIQEEPLIELSIARQINLLDGRCINGRNPRKLHTHIECSSTDERVYNEQNIELMAYEKYSIKKEKLVDISPDSSKYLAQSELHCYVTWLAARYSRPALPSKFNQLIYKADPKQKLRKIVEKSNDKNYGIYVHLNPDAEINIDESYKVNLLGLLHSNFSGNTSEVNDLINEYATAMRSVGIDVNVMVKSEKKVSVASIRNYKRLIYDDLSIREDLPLPVESLNIF